METYKTIKELIFIFVDNSECAKWLLKSGIFKYVDKNEHMTVIAQKHKNDRVEFISNPNQFLDKLQQNIAVFNKDEQLLVEVVFSDFTAFDERESEIAEHKQLLKDLKKESINFLNIQHAVLCKAPQQKVIVFDLDTGHKHQVDAGLADGLETCNYTSSAVEIAYRDGGVNQYQKSFERQVKQWNKVKAVK